MGRGGARDGSGRPKGSVSAKHAEVLAGAVSQGLTPVEYMLSILRDEDEDKSARAWAAEKAAPFVHPRPAPIARPIIIDLPDTDTVDGIKSALARITGAVAAGKISPSEAQSLSAIIEAQRKAIETGELQERIERLEHQADSRGRNRSTA